MEQYLNNLRTKPKEHKQRFALLVSGGFTLLVLIIWTFVMTTGPKSVARETTGTVNLATVGSIPVTPFGSIIKEFKSSWQALTNHNNE